jgi:hypothetical protein
VGLLSRQIDAAQRHYVTPSALSNEAEVTGSPSGGIGLPRTAPKCEGPAAVVVQAGSAIEVDTSGAATVRSAADVERLGSGRA